MQTYTPGVCNIGPEEIKMRMRAGWIALIATVIIGALLYWFQAPAWARIVLALPVFAAAIAFLQAGMHFCVAFASKGLFNMEHAVGQTESIEKAEFRKADQKKAKLIWTYAILIAVVAGILAFFI